jgi:hypothetical protein
MPPPPLPEAFVDPAQQWSMELDTWGNQGDQHQQQLQLSSQQVHGLLRQCCYKFYTCILKTKMSAPTNSLKMWHMDLCQKCIYLDEE